MNNLSACTKTLDPRLREDDGKSCKDDVECSSAIVASGLQNASDLATVLFALYQESIQLQNLRDIDGIIQLMHPQSVGRVAMQQFLEQLFNHFVFENTITKREFIGYDGDYAYCRFTQKIEKVSGPECHDTLVDNLVAFK
jgi:hypothetical protein